MSLSGNQLSKTIFSIFHNFQPSHISKRFRFMKHVINKKDFVAIRKQNMEKTHRQVLIMKRQAKFNGTSDTILYICVVTCVYYSHFV